MKKLITLLSIIIIISMSFSKSVFASEIGSKQTPGGIDYSDIANVIDKFIEEREAGLASFAISVFDEKGTIYNGYYGYSDIENNVKADKDTVYEWGSCSKLLVWVSVMQQWERGNLDLNTDIREYLPEGFLTKLQYPEEKITMINLMNHNAGFQESFYEKEEGANADDMYGNLEEAVIACECYQAFHVGEYTAYSNGGTALAAFIVERVSGMDYISYVHKNILEPLGMEKTSIDPMANDNLWVSEKRSELKCYSKTRDSFEDFGECRSYVMLFPVGAVMSTLEDFSKFGMAFVSEECSLFENNATRDEMFKTTSTYADTEIAKCCHGLWVSKYKVDVIGHGGNTGGCTANLVFDPVSKLGVCCLVNEAGETAFTQGLPGLLYGDITEREEYKNAVITENCDISGFYTMKRNIVKGAARAGQYTGGLMPLSLNDDGTYSMRLLGMDFGDAILVQLSDNEYVLTGNGENQYMYYKDGILEMSVMDLEQDAENLFGFFASYGYIIFGIICWAVLFIKFAMLIVRKIRKSDKKYTLEDRMILSQQAIYAVSGIIFAMFILFVGNQNYTFLVISAILAMLLGIVSLANSAFLAYNTHRGYEGFMNGSEGIAEGIINAGKVKEFKKFLKENDIDYDLYEREVDGHKAIYCHFDNKDADFFKIASTGTRSLALFYYWYIRMQKASFVFIDEFDAFYHFELSESVQKKVNEIIGVQIFTTTHNTDLMSNDLLRPDCYFLLKDSSIKAISELTEKELRQAHNLQKMYKAGAFNG